MIFKNFKKTDSELLNKVSKLEGSLIDNLKELNIFSSITKENKKYSLIEKSNTFSCQIFKNNKNFNFNFPNLMGKAHFCFGNFNENNFNLNLGTHLIKKKISSLFVNIQKKQDFINNSFNIYKAKIALNNKNSQKELIYERIGRLNILKSVFNNNLPIFNSKIEVGITNKNPFTKLEIEKLLKINYKMFFIDSNIKIGNQMGFTSLFDKFYLGTHVRGYKERAITPQNQCLKIGADSYANIQNRLGINMKGVELFAFADAGVCSPHNLKGLYENIKSFGDNTCTGKSVGVGLSLNSNISIVYAFPYTTNSETENFQFNFELEF